MAEKRVIEYEAASELANDDWLLIDGVTEGTRKARPSTVTAELGAQVTNIATAVGGLTQVAMGHEQSFAPSYDESASYDVGDLVMQYHGLYKCTAPTTGTWDAGKWARTEVSEQLEESGKIDDVQVNGTSVVTNKVASIDLTGMQADIDSKQADTKIGGASILDNNKVANLDFLASYGEASGSIASFNDGAAMPLKSLKVGIEPVQSGSGDPSPTNVRPISGWTEANVTRTGKNLYGGIDFANSIKDASPSGVIDTTNKTVTYSYGTGNKTTIFDTFKPLTSYTFLFKVADCGGQNFSMRIAYTDGTTEGIEILPSDIGNYVRKVSAPNKTVSKLGLMWYQSTMVKLYYDECGIFEGAITAQDFEPYNGTTYTTTLKDGQGNPLVCYGGELSNENGVQTLTADATENQKVKLSDLAWTYQSSNERFYCDTPITVKRPSSNTELPVYFGCECYKAVPYSSYTNGNITITSSGSMFVKDSNYTDTTTWLNAVGNNNVLLPLATPQQIPQDNLPIATQDGTNNLWADSGDILECKYVRDNSAVINDLIARVTALENE